MALLAGCSLPTLEVPECAQARVTAKEFYSYHFGNEMKFSEAALKPREKFLTPRLAADVRSAAADSDPFTTDSGDIPKAFRIGGCEKLSETAVRIEVLLFWRDDQRSEERRIYIEVVESGSKWLIDKILN